MTAGGDRRAEGVDLGRDLGLDVDVDVEAIPDVEACTPLAIAIPDIERLVAGVLDVATMPDSVIHGVTHWQSVGRMGAELLERGVGAAPAPLLLFALLHDCQRLDDGRDPLHGPRAARLVTPMRERGLFVLSDSEALVLETAIRVHNGGAPTGHATIGACQDADRLTLGRIMVEPDPRLLSHEVACDGSFIAWACEHCHHETPWGHLYERFDEAALRRDSKNSFPGP